MGRTESSIVIAWTLIN